MLLWLWLGTSWKKMLFLTKYPPLSIYSHHWFPKATLYPPNYLLCLCWSKVKRQLVVLEKEMQFLYNPFTKALSSMRLHIIHHPFVTTTSFLSYRDAMPFPSIWVWKPYSFGCKHMEMREWKCVRLSGLSEHTHYILRWEISGKEITAGTRFWYISI